MIICRMPTKPARVSPLYVVRLAAWLALECAGATAILAVSAILIILCVIDVKVLP